jgi:ABC-type Fe3+-hydroxamate transport system substrate-binding protein
MKENPGITFIKVIDQLGREIEFPFPPKRIVSTVPSQTELLFDLGLDEEIIGVTWFCIHPKDKVKRKAKIGGTKNLKIDKIKQLRPDLIIANKEENEKTQIEELAKEFPVWISDISDFNDSLEMIRKIGEITDKKGKAELLAKKIKTSFQDLPKAPPLRALYLIWKDPYMSVGADTFIHFMLDKIGLKNICSGESRYPELSEEKIKEIKPELVLLSSEPYPFKEKHIEELKLLLPDAKIMLVDGEMFSWYGSRLLQAPEYLKKFIKEI